MEIRSLTVFAPFARRIRAFAHPTDCSRACQKKHYKTHKAECERIGLEKDGQYIFRHEKDLKAFLAGKRAPTLSGKLSKKNRRTLSMNLGKCMHTMVLE